MTSFSISSIFVATLCGVVFGRHCTIHLKPNSGVFFANEGGMVSATCDLSCFGIQRRPYDIKWKSPEGLTISDTTGRIFTAPYHRGRKIKLFLTNVTTVDAGSYTCGGEINGDHQLVSFMLIVTDSRLGSVYPVAEDVRSTNEMSVGDFTREIRQHRSTHHVHRNVRQRKHRARRALPLTLVTSTMKMMESQNDNTTVIQKTSGYFFPANNISTGFTSLPTTNKINDTMVSETSTSRAMNQTNTLLYTGTAKGVIMNTTVKAEATTFFTFPSPTGTYHGHETDSKMQSDKPHTQALTTPAIRQSQTYRPQQTTARQSQKYTPQQTTDRQTQKYTPRRTKARQTKTYTPQQSITSTTHHVEHHSSPNLRSDQINAQNSDSFWGTNGLGAFVVVLTIAIILFISLVVIIVYPRWKKKKQTLVLRPKEGRLSRGNTNSAIYFNNKNDKPNPLLTMDNEELAMRSSTISIQGASESSAMKKIHSFTVIDLDDDVENESPNKSEKNDEIEIGDNGGKRESDTSLSSLLANAGLNKDESKFEDDESSSLERENERDRVDSGSDNDGPDNGDSDNGGPDNGGPGNDNSDLSVHSNQAKESETPNGIHTITDSDLNKENDETGVNDVSDEIEITEAKETDVMLVPEG